MISVDVTSSGFVYTHSTVAAVKSRLAFTPSAVTNRLENARVCSPGNAVHYQSNTHPATDRAIDASESCILTYFETCKYL